MAEGVTIALIAVFALAVAFDYVNGFHDTANAIATSVSTQALAPGRGIALAAIANFVGALTGTAVAATIGEGIVTLPEGNAGQIVVAAGLIGAITWDLITWRRGIPSSSSHALIGGLLGATLIGVGTGAINTSAIVDRVIVPLVGSPIIGFAGAFALMVLIFRVFRRADPRNINDRFRRLQVVSATYMAFAHGSNDAQKTMGVMTLALVTAGLLETFEVPVWVILLAATAMAVGTAAGGWRIIRTLGTRVVKLDPVHGFAAETAAATTTLGASLLGMPVSTTQVISSAIMGVGASKRLSAVRWVVAGNMVWAWILTIPVSALVAALAWVILSRLLAS